MKGRNRKKGHIIDEWIMVNDKVMQTYIYKSNVTIERKDNERYENEIH